MQTKMIAATMMILSFTTISSAQDRAPREQDARFSCREIGSNDNEFFRLAGAVRRCENSEVYCYLTAKSGIWCWPKGINVFSTPPSRTQGTGAPIILQAPPGSVEPIFEPSGPRK